MRYLLVLLFLFLPACSGGTDDSGDVGMDLVPDLAQSDVVPDQPTLNDISAPDVSGDATDLAALPDALDTEAVVPPPEAPVLSSYAVAPVHPEIPEGKQTCALIQEERCKDGVFERCDLYDTVQGVWPKDVPPMTLQAYTFDRYYDLYHEVEGQTMDFRFTQPIASGTPELEWSQPENFRKYDGYGDASGWTGTAVWAAAARYAATGSQADYQRMVDKLELVMFMYEVNGIPGMIVRSHWAMLPEGAPEPNGLWGKSVVQYRDCSGSGGHYCFPIPEKYHDRLPDYYLNGVDIGIDSFETQPYFQADASRDMYVRGLPGLLLAYDLLKDGEREDTIKAVMKEELSCTVNRLKKGRIINLQAVPELKEILMTYLAGGHMQFDEGEEEALTSLNELVFYVMEQPSPAHPELFDPVCPDGPPMEDDPAYVLDAEDPMFILDLAALGLAEAGGDTVDLPIAWSQHVSIRGADAVYVTQWALVAHYLTGDESYLAFMAQLREEIDYETSIHTYGALQLPKWCAPHYGPSLIYPSIYNLLARVNKEEFPKFWSMLAMAAKTEGRDRDIGGRDDCFFGILYNRMVDDEIDPLRGPYVTKYAEMLATYGMDPDNKLEPDRNYPRNWIDNPIPEIPLQDIPADDLALCTEPVSVMGVELPAPGLEDDWPRAVNAIPLPKRVGGAFLWQMDPWMAKREYGGIGMDEQWPMLGMTAPYWVGRADKVIEEGQNLVLVWRFLGECN